MKKSDIVIRSHFHSLEPESKHGYKPILELN